MAAVMMLDIRGFTQLAASLPPHDIVQLLTSLHARIVPVVRANGGVIDKFLGDGTMVTFGAVRESKTAAADALRALEVIVSECEAWEASLGHYQLGRPVSVNAAVTYGAVVFATLGNGDRLEVTVIGDAANLAAKLEKHNKVAGTRRLSHRICWPLRKHRAIGPIVPRGRSSRPWSLVWRRLLIWWPGHERTDRRTSPALLRSDRIDGVFDGG